MSTLGVLLVISEVYMCALQCGLPFYFLHFVPLWFHLPHIGWWCVGGARAGYYVNTKCRKLQIIRLARTQQLLLVVFVFGLLSPVPMMT